MKALNKVQQELFTKMKNREMKTKRVLDINLRMPKLKEIFTTVSIVYEAGMCIGLFFSDQCIKQIDFMLTWVCSVIDHGRPQKVVKTSVTHSLATARVSRLCFYNIL